MKNDLEIHQYIGLATESYTCSEFCLHRKLNLSFGRETIRGFLQILCQVVRPNLGAAIPSNSMTSKLRTQKLPIKLRIFFACPCVCCFVFFFFAAFVGKRCAVVARHGEMRGGIKLNRNRICKCSVRIRCFGKNFISLNFIG